MHSIRHIHISRDVCVRHHPCLLESPCACRHVPYTRLVCQSTYIKIEAFYKTLFEGIRLRSFALFVLISDGMKTPLSESHTISIFLVTRRPRCENFMHTFIDCELKKCACVNAMRGARLCGLRCATEYQHTIIEMLRDPHVKRGGDRTQETPPTKYPP